MSSPDDPFAPPPAGAQQPPWGAPRDAPWASPPQAGPHWQARQGGPAWQAPPPAPSGVGTAALVLGLIALITSISIIGGVLFGIAAILVGLSRRRSGLAAHRRTGKAVAGIALGALALLIAGSVWLYIRDDVARYRDCEKASVSIAQDKQCRSDLQRDLSPTPRTTRG